MTALVVKIAFGVIAVALGLWGYTRPKQGWPALVGALCVAVSGVAFHFGAFWPCILSAALAVIFSFAAVDYVDLGWRLRAAIVMAVCGIGIVSLWPTANVFSGGRVPCPEWVMHGVKFRLVAGLDLRGGLRLTYNVEVDEAIRDKRDRDYEEMRSELVRIFDFHTGDSTPNEEAYAKLRERVTLEAPRAPADVVLLTVKDPADASKIDGRFLDRFRGEMSYSVGSDQRSYRFRIKASVRADVRERAVGQAHQIILRRVDELGLREASVSTRDEDVIVEVPGEDESSFSQIRDIISQTARLEFKLLDDDTDYFGPLRQSADKTSLPDGLTFRQETTSVGMDPDGDPLTKVTTYSFLERQGEETSKQALERFRAWAATLTLPADRELGYELAYEPDPATNKETEVGWRTYLLKSRAEITGDQIRDAVAQPDQGPNAMGGWHVALTFSDSGGTVFERITGANIKRRFAIILDGRVESAPVIQSRIAGGHASITLGSSDTETQLREARKLEMVLRSGALPASITPINEQRVGPTLGRDAIERAVQSAVVGSVLVLLFMFIYYRRSGLIADVVVLMNLMLQMAILSSLGASMTLPGICGLALTIGMSVDSNVLINERLRDETRAGKTPRSAIDVGFKRALTAIIDGHVTTLIAGVVLFQFGTGPIKGFASALLVGMAVNLFTGVVVSRVLFDLWVRGFRTPKLDMGGLEFFPVGKTLNFMGKTRAFVTFSILVSLATVVLMFVPGPVYGTDFKGGTEVEVALKREVEAGKIREAVEKAGFDDPEVVRVEEGRDAFRYLIRVHEVSAIDETTQNQIRQALCFGESLNEAECPVHARPSELKISPGGDKLTLRYESDPELGWVRERMKSVAGVAMREGANNPVLTSVAEHKVEIQFKGKGDQILDGLRTGLGAEVVPDTMLRSEWIGPKAGAQLRSAAFKSVAVAFLFIMLYVALRFDLRFAPGAVVAVGHDALVTVGVLILFGKEINLTTVAALLTVVGYSSNDNVVIYDRIRENMHKIRGMTFTRLINVSLSETFSRTIITGGPTILSLCAFFLWGTGALKDFAFTLIVGTIIGTYSSMYIAVPFTSWLDERFFSKKKASARKPSTAAPARA